MIHTIRTNIGQTPVAAPELVGVYQHDRDNADSFRQFSYADFTDLRSAKDVAFTDLFAFRFTSVGLQGDLPFGLAGGMTRKADSRILK